MAYTYGNTQNAAERIKRKFPGVNPPEMYENAENAPQPVLHLTRWISSLTSCNLCTERRH